MYAIYRWGSEEQKQQYLPRMATGELIGCFGLSESDAGSDPGSMRTFARRDGDDWVINGSKMWITNGSIADVAIVWAATDEGIRGFILEKGMPGFTAPEIHRKLSLRARHDFLNRRPLRRLRPRRRPDRAASRLSSLQSAPPPSPQQPPQPPPTSVW
jgi:alkylation response protein AidB-like acyl-CoA dehydrogenase